MCIQPCSKAAALKCLPYKEAMDAMVGPVDEQLCKHHRPLCMHSAVCDPVLLSQCGGCVDDELLGNLVVVSGGLHLHSIVACGQTHKKWKGGY